MRKAISWILALAMMLSALSINAAAEGDGESVTAISGKEIQEDPELLLAAL